MSLFSVLSCPIDVESIQVWTPIRHVWMKNGRVVLVFALVLNTAATISTTVGIFLMSKTALVRGVSVENGYQILRA